MTRILIAPDSFKDALPAVEVSQAIARGWQMARPADELVVLPLADGGEGTLEVLTLQSDGHFEKVEVNDPLFRPVEGRLGLSGDGHTAFVEMAQAAGIQLLARAERNCLYTTTFGVGELILGALERGARRILLGIGSSATNDAGIGMASALGYRFLDERDEELRPVGENLGRIRQIDDSQLRFDPAELEVTVLCDVDNPLFGPRGAAHTYARQKGATEEGVLLLDAGLESFSTVLKGHFGRDFSQVPGAGAAGGMGAGALAFLGAMLRPGIQTVMELTGFDARLEQADLVITGEGKVDEQTLYGKLILGITRKAAARQIPVLAFCGTLEATPAQIQAIGLQAAFSLLTRPCTLEEAIAATADQLEQLAFNVARCWNPPGSY
ncbi:MAG: glycerate kinase [Saprospiraceae bacterium]|nr:glycerate kinase [Saprospiraceae bacterium]